MSLWLHNDIYASTTLILCYLAHAHTETRTPILCPVESLLLSWQYCPFKDFELFNLLKSANSVCEHGWYLKTLLSSSMHDKWLIKQVPYPPSQILN